VIGAAAIVLAAAVSLALLSIADRERPEPPFLLFRTLAPPSAHGRVAWRPLDAAHAARHLTPLRCARIHYRGGAGVCLVEEPRGRDTTHAAYVLDRRFSPRARIALAGIPVRGRVSPDGRVAAVTVYAEEESPAGERLAAETLLIDLVSGRPLGDLREFALDSAGFAALRPPFDLSSVAFHADSDRFFATLTSDGERYLVLGSIRDRRLRAIRRGIANEALSPDGRRLIAKRPRGDRGEWQVIVIDLDAGTEQALPHPRSIDDQVDWLDAAHVVYHDVTETGTGIWALPADGTSGPRLLIADAFSPSVAH
jgi:hypothetical protein